VRWFANSPIYVDYGWSSRGPLRYPQWSFQTSRRWMLNTTTVTGGGLRGGTLGKLNSITFRPKSESAPAADFLETFTSTGLTTPTTLSEFVFYTPHPWRPNYRPLLSFKQLRKLEIEFSCEGGCSSTIDDDFLTDMVRAMPKLETLRLGREPCEIPTGVTAKGLAVLAHHCPNLSDLRIHFRVDSFDATLAISGTPHPGTTAPRKDCALRSLDVGRIPMPEESVWVAVLTLVCIFPRVSCIYCYDENWERVLDAFLGRLTCTTESLRFSIHLRSPPPRLRHRR
jgi:hypothetical protein